MADRDPVTGRFLPGHSLASKGGKARAAALTPERRRDIARQGRQAMIARHFNGDAYAADQWLARKGQYAQDRDISTRWYYQAEDPGPHPGAK